ncbi:MAG: hypothetical protein AAFV93_20160 [Chloroflexota bacterium]
MRRLLYITLAIAVLLTPIVIVNFLLLPTTQSTLLNYVPFYNDELYHWHQSVSFMEAGFNSGYYTLNENIPLADYSHFYAWGAWVYALYGTLGNIFGFTLNSIMVFNLGFYLLAVILFILMTRPSFEGLITTGFVLSTFIPLLLYIPSSMLQVLNIAIAIVLASVLYLALTRPISWRLIVPATIFIMAVSFIRPTYALYLPPLFALAYKKRTVKSTILSGFFALPLVLIAAVGFYISAAPFPHFRTLLFLGDDPLTVKLMNLGAYVQQSFIWMTQGASIVIGQRIMILTLIILLIIWGIYRWRTRHSEHRIKNGDDDSQWGWELALHLYNLVGFYTATIVFHETLAGHDYRAMAYHFLLSLLLLVLFQRRALYVPMIAMAFFLLPALAEEYNYKQPNFTDTVPRQFADWRSLMGDDIQYDPNAPSPWCNTVTTSAFYVLDAAGNPGMLLAIDPGIGLSWTFDWVFTDFDLPIPSEYKIPETFQSRYLILTDEDYNRFGQFLNLQRLERAPEGSLYLNLDAECE